MPLVTLRDIQDPVVSQNQEADLQPGPGVPGGGPLLHLVKEQEVGEEIYWTVWASDRFSIVGEISHSLGIEFSYQKLRPINGFPVSTQVNFNSLKRRLGENFSQN